MNFRPCYFFHTLQMGWVGFEICGKFHTFFKPSPNQILDFK